MISAQSGFEYAAVSAHMRAQAGDINGMGRQLAAAHALAVWACPALLDRYQALEAELGRSWYARMDAPTGAREKAVLAALSPEMVKADMLAGDPITAKITKAPGNSIKPE